MATKTATTPLCECGCRLHVVRPTARFVIGHDAKLKSQLIRTVLANGPDAAKAKSEIARLGWTDFLTISQAAQTRKAKRAAATAKAATQTPAQRKASKLRAAATAAKATARKAAKRATPGPAEAPAASEGRVPASVNKLGSAAVATS